MKLPSQATLGSPLKFVSHLHNGLAFTSSQNAFLPHAIVEQIGAEKKIAIKIKFC